MTKYFKKEMEGMSIDEVISMRCFPYPLGANVVLGNSILGELPATFGSNPLPLLVREAVQNSLDAAVDPSSGTVEVTFCVHSVLGSDLSRVLASTDFGAKPLRFLEISDYGTTGLDGRLDTEISSINDMGRFWRFLLSMGVNQSREGAGGSWGMGKSLYHLAGQGLVVFDSRLASGERRLCAKAVFDQRECRPNWLRRDSPTGVVFWGASEILPITSDNHAAEWTSRIGLPSRSRPGTSCFVLLHDDYQRYLDSVGQERARPTEADFHEQLQLRLLKELRRWYFPRLIPNSRSQLKAVFPDVHESHLLKHPIFRKFEEFLQTTGSPVNGRTPNFQVILVPKPAGQGDVAIAHLVWEDVQTSNLVSQGWESIHELLSPENDTPSRSYCALVRGSGMVVKYETGLLGAPADPELVRLGLIMIKGDAKVPKPGDLDTLISAEEYFRRCEGKDHSGWDDRSWRDRPNRERSNYFRYLESRVRETIAPKVSGDDDTERNRHIGRVVGRLLVGDYGFGFGGHSPSPKHGGTSGGAPETSSRKTGAFEFTSVKILIPGTVEFRAKVSLSPGQVVKVVPKAISTTALNASQWKEEAGYDAPWLIRDVQCEIDAGLVWESFPNGLQFSPKVIVDQADVSFAVATSDQNLRFTMEVTYS